MSTRADLINAFVPASSMNDPARFAGRSEQIKELADAINTSGSVPLIYGERGLGKSSVAAQLSHIAQGDTKLLSALGAKDWAPSAENQAIAFYVTCDDSTDGLEGLLKLMINAIHKLNFEEARIPGRKKFKMVDKTTKTGISFKVFSHEQVRSYRESVAEQDLSNLSLSEQLVSLSGSLTSTYKQPVLFIIDELDRLDGVKGFSGFLKANSSPILKFVLVGIATTESELLSDHKSLGRQLIPVQIPTMSPSELESIVTQTESYLASVNQPYTFSSEAKTELAKIASGYPWFVHVIGKRALVDADESGIEVVEKIDISSAVNKLATRQMAQTYFDQYQMAVRDSAPREIVLRLFARWPHRMIPTGEVYPMAKQLNVSGATTYVGHLTQDQCGRVLSRAPQQRRALYYFSDHMFKVYVNLRSSIYQDVSAEVNAVTKYW